MKRIPVRIGSKKTLNDPGGFTAFRAGCGQTRLELEKRIHAPCILRYEMYEPDPHDAAARIGVMPDFQRDVRRHEKRPAFFANGEFTIRIDLVMSLERLCKNIEGNGFAMAAAGVPG